MKHRIVWFENCWNFCTQGWADRRALRWCRELTKKHETVFATTLEEAIGTCYKVRRLRKGNVCWWLEGKSREQIEKEAKEQWEELSVEEHMEQYLSQGMDRKAAMKAVAKDRGITKREVYQYLEQKKSEREQSE